MGSSLLTATSTPESIAAAREQSRGKDRGVASGFCFLRVRNSLGLLVSDSNSGSERMERRLKGSRLPLSWVADLVELTLEACDLGLQLAEFQSVWVDPEVIKREVVGLGSAKRSMLTV